MVYSRQLNLGKEVEGELLSYIEDELTKHLAERQSWLDDITRHQRDYWAEPAKEAARRPWKGAAQVIIPLSAIAAEAIHAKTMTRMFGLPQIVSVKAKQSGITATYTTQFERFMDSVLKDIKYKDSIEDSILEIEKFGTGVGKSGYERVVKTIVVDAGGIEEEREVVVKSGACAYPVSITRFMMPLTETDPQVAEWCGEQLGYTPYQFYLAEKGGLFKAGSLESIGIWFKGSVNNQDNTYADQQERNENRTPTYPSRIVIYEIWLAWDVDDSGIRKEICLHYHRDSRSFVSVRYNPYYDGHRPYRVGRYIRVEGRWPGIGICKQSEQFQREVTAQHRLRLDNAALANMRMIKISKMSGYGPDEEIYPGKMWFVNDMTHIDSIQMGEVYPSAYNNESMTVGYQQQRSGVNEITTGMPSSGTPDTATSSLTRVQEGNKKFDYAYSNIKEFANELITDIACNIQQFGAKRIEYLDLDPEGTAIRAVLEMPKEFLRDAVMFDISVASEQENKLVNRQNWTQVAGMLSQYFTGAIQLSQMIGDPRIMQLIAMRGLTGSTEAMRQVLETYDARNIEQIIPMELLTLGQQNGQANPQLSLPPGSGGASPINAGQGLGVDPQILQQLLSGAA